MPSYTKVTALKEYKLIRTLLLLQIRLIQIEGEVYIYI